MTPGDFDCSGVIGFFRKFFTDDCGGGSGDIEVCDPYVDSSCGEGSLNETDTIFGITKDELDQGLEKFGVGKDIYRKSLDSLVRDTTFVYGSMRNAIRPFTQCLENDGGSSGVIDFSFSSKIPGLNCDQACKLDLRNVSGFNAADTLNVLITFMLVTASCVRLIRVAKTFGQAA